ncbi:transporter [Phenylobacterium hankyongense]|uniref:Transporter n=1 Tax=Phenylobacterium hankyongense TaxID=1813876 RepID=A0A328AYM3_9CAUL|nr:TolC family protein [Phenylobacterium hankyongense]RAK60210.1 transporter [Phenylobacterium hankyongense]
MSPVQWLPTLVVAAALASPAAAAPLTYAGALDLAARSAPSLQAGALKVDAARAASRAAGRLPDPKLSVGVDNFPVSGPPAGRFNADGMTMARIGVVQDVPNAARRRAEVAAGSAEIGVAEAEATLQQRNVRVATALAWIDLAYAERRLAALDQLVDGLNDLWAAQPATIASGASRPAVGLEPKRLQAVFADRRSELAAAAAKARAELSRWTGDPAPTASGDAPHYDIDPAALHAALDRHPSLLTADAAERRAGADVDAARAATQPDWGFEVSYGRRDPMFGDMVSAGVTMSLPLFKSTRQAPLIAARLADRNRMLIEREDRRRTLVAALDGDIAEHVMHHDQWRRAVEVLAPTAEQRAHLELASYAAARAGFDDVRAALTDLADAKLTALEREAMVARDGARIVLTYGSDQ